MEPLKALVIKISELYDKLFGTWTRIVIFFLAYYLVLIFLPDKLATPIAWVIWSFLASLLAFNIIGIIGQTFRKKDSDKS